MYLTNVRHKWHEKDGFSINRPLGYAEYTILSFYNDIDLLINGKNIKLHNGAVLIYNVGTPQNWRSCGHLCHDWMHLNKDFGVVLKKYGIDCDTVFYPKNIEAVRELFGEIEIEFFNLSLHREEMLDLLCNELCIRLSRGINAEILTNSKNIFTDLRMKVHSSLDKKWTVEMMAKEVSLSKSRFFSVYKKLFHISPTEDLINAKTDKAKYYLKGTNLSISEIASAVGYENVSHFCRQFKKRCGITPSEYKNK